MPVFFGVTSELLCATETWWWHFWHTTLSNLSQRPQSQRTFFLQSRYADMQVVPIVYHLLPFVMHKIIPWSYNRTYNLLPKPLFYAVISIFNFQSAIMNPCHHHHLSIRILETSLPSHHPWEWHILFHFLLVNRQCLVFCDNLDFILNPQSSLGIGNSDHNSIPFVFDRSRNASWGITSIHKVKANSLNLQKTIECVPWNPIVDEGSVDNTYFTLVLQASIKDVVPMHGTLKWSSSSIMDNLGNS